MADTIPYYKITSDYYPTQYTTDETSAYYGAQKSRSRRESQTSEVTRQYESGQKTYEEYQQDLNRILGRSIGSIERSEVGGYGEAAQQREWGISDTDMASKYAQGKIGWDEYNSYLENTLGRYTTGSSQYEQRSETVRQIKIDKDFSDIDELVAQLNTGKLDYETVKSSIQQYLQSYSQDTENYNTILSSLQSARDSYVTNQYNSLETKYNNGEITYEQYKQQIADLGNYMTEDLSSGVSGETTAGDIVIPGVGTINDIYSQLEEEYYTNEDETYSQRYEQGLISFSDYADYLKNRLTTYQDETQKYGELTDTWKNAYNTELYRYFEEVSAQNTAGTISAEEWADFQSWYETQVEAGPKMQNFIEQFIYSQSEQTPAPIPVPTPTPYIPTPISPTTPSKEGSGGGGKKKSGSKKKKNKSGNQGGGKSGGNPIIKKVLKKKKSKK